MSGRARRRPGRGAERDEHVASLAANRNMLLRDFGVPTPVVASIRRAWDKREIYRLGDQLSIAISRTWFPRAEADPAAIDAGGPLVVKPAITGATGV